MKSRHLIRGFTLLELLVAVAITLVIAGLMLTVTSQVLGLWQRTQGAHAQAATARQVFDLLERDLQAALPRSDATCRLAVDILDSEISLANHGWLFGALPLKPADGGSLRPLPDPDANGLQQMRDARFGLSGTWLRFITTNVESGGSLPTIVAYQLVRRPVTGEPLATNPAPVRYSLYRSVVSPEETFANGYDVLSPAYGSTSNTPSSALSTAYRLPRNVSNPSHANLLAGNVVDFGCWLYRRTSDGELVRIYPGTSADVSHHATGQSTLDESRFPVAADVMLRVLSESGAAVLEAIETGRVQRPPEHATDDAWWWAIVEANSSVFLRRIEIKGVAP